MRLETCRFCQQKVPHSELVAICRCAKKRDTGRAHLHCLRTYVERYHASEDTLATPKCVICSQSFAVSLRQMPFSCERCWSERGADVTFQMFTMVIMSGCIFFVFYIIWWDHEHTKPGQTQQVSDYELKWFAVMGVAMVVMLMFTVKKISERFRQVTRPLKLEIKDVV